MNVPHLFFLLLAIEGPVWVAGSTGFGWPEQLKEAGGRARGRGDWRLFLRNAQV